ncbi:hypothetical protein VF04_04220 [Nostoc linckia z7]|uniref:Uncharacterized protein n=2 Tax=Nostoc linckia TaxID=92942 RepID=A0A9Q6EN59_NOSLI|nr:hypothetical protein [Nostoc linckia]PHK42919.1 hypothetical protein VF12_00920 [Nostoc linckia z15]PHK48076.1 hypothetical protein VF13_01895 [Nostoc linckia z16]PHJ64996.1 hypothetical protein VF02_11705 [Nostoc linckia z1]PHJ70174.1 hypothetical protein VF05_11865 [Nostoc linckia z3]PHJ75075.1 hypothetical protein VF03_12025 [Nostoc linckia z2]
MNQLITQAQASRLWAIAYKELGLKEKEVRLVFGEFGVTSTTDIPLNQYNQVLQRLKEYADVEF